VLSYEELTSPEREVWDAYPTGRLTDLRVRGSDDDPEFGETWGPERTVRATVLAALLLGANPGSAGVVPALRLTGARIISRLDLSGGEIAHGLWLEGCWFEQGISAYGAATRTIGLSGSRIPGVDATMARIEGRFELRGSAVRGQVSLMNARIAGELILSDAILSAPGEWALFAGGLVMGGGAFLNRSIVHGGIRLPGAQLPGGLSMKEARVHNPGAHAVIADHASASTMAFTRGFTAQGTIRLRGAQIADQLAFDDAVLDAEGTALDCTRMQAGDFVFTPAAPPSGAVDLRGARVATLHDRDGAWPDVVRLQGFTYDALLDKNPAAPDSVARRVAWIRRDPGYVPRQYEQLASWYRQIGHDDDARRVLLAKQRNRRSTLSPAGRVWSHMIDAVVGHGYRPWLAGIWIVALTVLGTVVFSTQTPEQVQKDQGPPFHALVYTLDLLMPIGGLGQRSAWYFSTGVAQWLAYVLIAAGWLLTTAVVAGVTRALSKN
jgi:hypothetical protein